MMTEAASSAVPAVGAAPLADQVFETLRGWIVNGQLQPGYHLRVRDVADLVGTSVMPVREAVRRLVEAGLAVHEPYKGARVRGLDVSELEQAYDVRILLEGECARLGAQKADVVAVERMQSHWNLLEGAVRSGDVTAALEQDELLLGALYQSSGNEIMFDVIRGLWDKCRPYKVLWVAEANRRKSIESWHSKPELIAAARAGDGQHAEIVLRNSYMAAKLALRSILTTQA